MKHVPNALSLARIAITPVFLVLFVGGTFVGQSIALSLFVLGAISDWLDGAVARRYGVGTRLGQFLDPLADKVLVLGAFFAIFFLPADEAGRTVHALWWWIPIGAIAIRDFAVTGLRSWAEKRGRPVRTRGAAKAKTGVQLTFLIALQVVLVAAHLTARPGLAGEIGGIATTVLFGPIPDVLLLLTAVLTVWTGASYFLARTDEPAASEPSLQADDR